MSSISGSASASENSLTSRIRPLLAARVRGVLGTGEGVGLHHGDSCAHVVAPFSPPPLMNAV